MKQRLFLHALRYVALCVMLVAGTVSANASALEAAQTLIDKMSHDMLSCLQQESVRKSRQRIFELVNEVIIPHVDSKRVSIRVLGKHWKTATPAQRRRFAEEFRCFLIRFYGTALSEYAKDNEIPEDLIAFQSVRGQPGATHLNIHAKVHQPNGTDVQVGYKLYLVNGTWKIVDIRVAGVSMVATYRSSFAREIRRGGLDRLIQKLAERNKKALGV